MKNLNYLRLLSLLMCIMIGLSACSDNDDNKTLGKLDGVWAEVKEECFLNDELVKTEDKSNWAKWNFNLNGEVVRYAPTFTDKGTFSFEGDKLKIQLEVIYSNNKSWIENMNCTILELTDNTLIWMEPYKDTEYDYTIMYLTKVSSNDNNLE